MGNRKETGRKEKDKRPMFSIHPSTLFLLEMYSFSQTHTQMHTHKTHYAYTVHILQNRVLYFTF